MRKVKLFLLTLVALVGGLSASAAKTVYVDPVGTGTWMTDNAKISLYVFGDGDGWANSETLSDGVIKFTFDDKFTSMIIVRGQNQNTWEGKWNQTDDITDIQLNKLYKANGYNDGKLAYTVEDYAEPSGYFVNFNTAIATSSHDFAVASNWGHVSGYDAAYDSNMSYSWSETAGVDKTGALLAYRQFKYDWGQSSSGVDVYDLLVTPQVKGTVSLAVKQYSGSNSYIEFYEMTDNGDGTFTRGDKIDYTMDAEASFSQSAYVTVSINVTDFARIGIRASYMYLDNFAAEEANIIPEKGITIASANPTATTGTIYWDQQANGKVLVKYTVTVKNTGDVDLTQGTEGYSVSIFNRTTEDVYSTTAVPQDLAVGETSEPFDVQAEVETSVWPNTYSYYSMDLRENLKNTVLQRAQSRYNAYQSKFVFRAAESTSTSSITTSEAWGTITESTTKSFEIYNDGLAPLTIKSITLPEGFTSDNAPEIPSEGLVLNGKEKVVFNVTQDATAYGTFAGNLVVSYLSYGSEEATEYSLAFSATIINANTWTADFNNTKSGIVYPAGAIAEAGINSDYDYNSGTYNYWITGRTQSSYASANNMFITPKLHANAGESLAYDVKGAYSSSYYAKVYVSTDRKNWEQVAYYTQNETEGAEAIGYSNWYSKQVTFSEAGDYYVAFSLYGTFKIDNLVGLEKVDVAHDLYIKSVNWPDASIKSGASQSKPSVDIIPLTDEAEDAYTVKYICGETVLAEGTPVALTASANSSKTFSFSWTPVVESTTLYENTKVVFEFTDGTKIESETFDLTVTNEPKFHFLSSLPSSKWNEPSDVSTPIAFGKTNKADTKNFYVYNWGSAPLTVKSIVVPEGFTATPAEQFVVAAFNESDLSVAAQAVEITFSATEAGTYSGDMVITYLNGANEEQIFTLAISGTKLDPTKFYANFDKDGELYWPAGSVYSGISGSNGGTYAAPNYYISGTGMFVTPKMTVAAGDKMTFDAKLYSSSSYYADGSVTVYVASTRDEVMNAEEGTTRTQIFKVSGEDTENPITTDYQTFEVTFANAGEYYIGFDLYDNVKVDEIYGLKQAAVAHDLKIASNNIPAEAMQNVAATATVNILNLGLADEAADAYTATLFVNGEAVATAEAVALPMVHQLSAAGTQLSFNFRYPKAGTFPAYIEVKAGDYSVATDPVDVEFAEEVASGDIAVGESAGLDGTTPLNLYYKNSETIALYTQDKLGLSGGEKINSITWKGVTTKAHTSTLKVYYQWTDDTSITSPASTGNYDVTGMTAAIEPTSHSWTVGGSAEELQDQIVVNFSTPLVYEAGKSLLILVSSSASGYASTSTSVQFEKSNITGYAFLHYNDGTEGTFTGSWSAKNLPLIHLGLEVQATTFSGTVKNAEGEAIENATVTLVSNDGDNVQYAGTTDAEGAYSINVIQATRTYDVTVSAEDYDDANATVKFNGESQTKDFTLLKTITFTATFTTDYGWADVYAYAWSGEGEAVVEFLGDWPGTKLEAVDGVYTVTFKAENAPEKIIFNNGNSGEGNQTADLDFENGKAYELKVLFANGSYYIKNVGTQKFLAAGANWGTHAIVNETGLDFGIAFVNGKYTLDSQVSNGGNNNYLNGEWTDGAAFGWTFAEVAEGVYTISNGTKFLTSGESVVSLADDGTIEAAQWTLISVADRNAANLASLDAATAENGVDATFFIKGANFSRNDLRNKAWTHTRNGGNETFGGPNENRTTYGCEYWNNTFEVSQTITDLPEGVYEFSIAGFGTNGTTYVYANETEKAFVNTTSAANFGAALEAIANGEYTGNTTGKVAVIDGTLKIAVKRTSQVGQDWTVFDNARLTFYGPVPSDEFKTLYEETLAAAQAALANEDYAVVTGVEKTALEQAISDNTTVADNKEAYEAAITALGNAMSVFTSAKAAYQSLADAKAAVEGLSYQYASAEKKAAAEAAAAAAPASASDATAMAETVYVTFRQYAESGAMLEGVEGATDFTSYITNPDAENNMNGWVLSGKASVKNGEPFTDGNGNSNYKYFDSDQWGDGSWNISLSQNIKLPKGKYLLTVKSRASAELTSFNVFAGEDKIEMQHIGNAGGLFNRGWNDASVEFELTEAGAITIGVQGIAASNHQWMSFSDFRLVRFTEYEPVYTVAGGFNTTEGGQQDVVFGTTWDPSLDANNMVKQTYGDGSYKLEKKGVVLTAGTIYYKVVGEHSWNYLSWGFGDENANYVVSNIPDGCESAVYDITFTFSPDALLSSGYNVNCELELDEVATAIRNVETNAQKTANVYDMQGRKMEGNLKKGVYVINGKKTVVK